MVDHMRPISLAALYNLSITAERGNDRLFTIDEIAEAAQPFPTVGYNDLRSSLGTYLAGAVRSGDLHFTGNPFNGAYMLTNAGQKFYAKMVDTAVAARQQAERMTAIVPTTSSSNSTSSSRFIPGTLVLSAAGARDFDYDDADNDSGSNDSAAPAARDNSATRKFALSSSSAQCSENHPSACLNQQSSSSSPSSSTSSSRPADNKRPRYSDDDKEAGGIAAAASGKDATSKKPPTFSSQPADNVPHPGGSLPKPVEQYDLTSGRTIALFDSHADAERATGISHGSISGCVRGKVEHAGGFGWRRPGAVAGAEAAYGSHQSHPALSKPSTCTYSRLFLLP